MPNIVDRYKLAHVTQPLREMAAQLRDWAGERKYSPDQPRAPAGQSNGGHWVAAGGLIDRVRKEGGFTYSVADGTSPKPGDKKFSVAGDKSTERIIPLDKLTEDDLFDYVSDNLKTLMNRPGVHFGGWVEGGSLWLDCPTVVDNLEEAKRIGNAADQEGIWSFETMETIYLKPRKPQAGAT